MSLNAKAVLKIIKFGFGKVKYPKYIVQHELIDGSEFGGEDLVLKIAYTEDGKYIGEPKIAKFICYKKHIQPEFRTPTSTICSIGFCEEEKKWYGWSHRAIYGFKIGDKVEEGDCCTTSGYTDEYIRDHPEEDISLPVGFIAKTLDDCKRMACAFAESVS